MGKAWQGLAITPPARRGFGSRWSTWLANFGNGFANCLAPGAIMAADWEAEHFAEVLEKVPLGRSGSAEDIAAGVQFLLEHATLTGHVLHVDGGWSMNAS